jgi:hypothetical protein
VRWNLRPPTVVTPASQPQIVVASLGSLAFQSRRPANWKLRPPTVVIQSPVQTTIRATLARQIARRLSSWKLRPPTVVTPLPPVVTNLRIALAASFRRSPRSTISKLGAPAVVASPGPPVVTKVRVALASWKARGAHPKLFPPATLVVPSSPVVTKLRTTFAARRPRFHTLYQLRAPAVIGTPGPPVETVLRAYLAKTPLPARGEGYSLGAPQIVNLPPVLPLRISLAALFKRPPRGTIAVLGVPTVVGPFVAPPPPPPEPSVPQTPTNFGAFIDRRERRMERREWLVTRRRGG